MTTTTNHASATDLTTRLQAIGLTRVVRGRVLVDHVTLSMAPGEVVAIIGSSGSGKTSLLEGLVGLHPPTSGSVRVHGVELQGAYRQAHVGLVPQDDIVHADLTVRSMLRHAARLRLRDATTGEVTDVVERVLADLDMSDRGDVRVRHLSGGQRKRASIGVELLSRPPVLALDEPTSGLDPAAARDLLGVLRRLARSGTTIVLTTHAVDDVVRSDRVLVVAPGGRLAYDGGWEGSLAHFGVTDLVDVSAAAAHVPVGGWPVEPAVPVEPARPSGSAYATPATPAGWARQLVTLVRRASELMISNPLTAAILIGSPVLVIAMLATLFRPGTIGTDPVQAVQLAYWIAFAGFFFGLTYGLLQIVTELQVLRRESSWGLSMSAYVTSKVVVLLPILVGVDVALFAVLRALDRLPAADPATWARLVGVFLLDATAGLALGLLASASVSNAAQATLALPMLCFPQVLFSGAVVPVVAMTGVGGGISAAMSNRWSFEAIARVVDLGDDDMIRRQFGNALDGVIGTHVGVLALVTVGATVATTLVLRGRRPGA